MGNPESGREWNEAWLLTRAALEAVVNDPHRSRAERVKAQRALRDSVSTDGGERLGFTYIPDSQPKTIRALALSDAQYEGYVDGDLYTGENR